MTAVLHPSVDERSARGRAAREQLPPSAHAAWAPAPDRPDPVALLEEQNASRDPDLVPVRHGRMLVSPFTFYRGAAKIMATDLNGHANSRIERTAVRRRAPLELRCVRVTRTDVGVRTERLRRDASGSVRVRREAHGGELRDRGPQQRLHPDPMPAPRRSESVASYRAQMAELAEMRTLDIWYAQPVGSKSSCAVSRRRCAPWHKRDSKKAGKTAAKNCGEAGAEGAHPRQPAGAVEAGRARRWPIPDRQPTADR